MYKNGRPASNIPHPSITVQPLSPFWKEKETKTIRSSSLYSRLCEEFRLKNAEFLYFYQEDKKLTLYFSWNINKQEDDQEKIKISRFYELKQIVEKIFSELRIFCQAK